MQILESVNGVSKVLRSDDFNMSFRRDTGVMVTWGKTQDEDPDVCPYGPLIADIEISAGGCSGNCAFCYKGNHSKAPVTNMSLATFKQIFHKFPRTLTQIAFGITDIDTNPDIWEIMNYCRNNDYNVVIPNVTINGRRMTSELFDKLAATCGAVAVSYYDDDECFNAVQELSKRGMKQVNIHAVLSKESYHKCYELIDKAATDPRLKGLYAIVFLSLKPKGRGARMKPLRSVRAYRRLVEHAGLRGVGFGFDSCGANSFIEAVKGMPNGEYLRKFAEPCEAYGMSIYVDVGGRVWPCSFCEGVEESVNLLSDGVSFMDIWNGPLASDWRARLKKSCRSCPVYNVGV